MIAVDPRLTGPWYSHWQQLPDGVWVWKHFKPTEIACHGDGSIAIDSNALDRLEALRSTLDRPLIINSGYRAPWYNKKIGGEADSQHLLGKAFDIAALGVLRTQIIDAAKSCGFTGTGLYDNFVHVDIGPARSWDRRKETK